MLQRNLLCVTRRKTVGRAGRAEEGGEASPSTCSAGPDRARFEPMADFVAEVAEEESDRWRRGMNLACHSPVRVVVGTTLTIASATLE